MTRDPRFWLRWSIRDLRRRWPLILAIGLLLAGGTGLAAGLGSMRDWRVASNDASFSALKVHDLRAEAEEGAFAPEGALARAATRIPDAGSITALSERLIVPTQIAASFADGKDVITPGQMFGIESAPQRTVAGVRITGPPVDAVAVQSGAALPTSGRGPVGLLESEYARLNGIEAPTQIELPGGGRVRVIGLGTSPETFVVTGPGGAFSSGADFGSLFVPLGSAQRLAGRPAQVNDLVLTVSPGADLGRITRQLDRQIAEDVPGFGFNVSRTADIAGYRILYEDADNDQQLFDIFAFLILAGAAFGAFNLISRTIEAQRREIGVGMALGLQPSRLAIRPMMMGLQISVLGVLLGVLVGLGVTEWLRSLLVDQLPLPIVETNLRVGNFALRAAICFVVPLVAAAWPVLRGVRVTPIEAIRVGFHSARSGGLAPLVARIPVPGGSLAQIPPRNVLRAPRRTLLTVLASGAVIAVAVSMSGMLDSFEATVERNSAEELRTAPDRIGVTLDRFYPAGSAPVRAIEQAGANGPGDSKLTIAARLSGADGEQFDAVVDTIPGGTPLWQPRVSAGRLPSGPSEVLIAESAAKDLGVEPGDRITLHHPRQLGPGKLEAAMTPVLVSGTHPDPFRFPVYMSPASESIFGLSGRVNSVDLLPPQGIPEDEFKRSLIGLPGVATVESASTLSRSLDEGLEDFASIIRVVVIIAMVLVLLIAFNSTAINADERAREHATMLAYGVPVHTVVRMAVLENLIMGILATMLGVLFGSLILGWVINVNLKEVLPELGMVVSLSPESILLAAVAGAGAMALAPLLTVRRLRNMDVPSTLRVVE